MSKTAILKTQEIIPANTTSKSNYNREHIIRVNKRKLIKAKFQREGKGSIKANIYIKKSS